MIRFDKVTKQFTQDAYGVTDITFEIEPGEFVVLTGKSGAGKTTLMRLMTKEYVPSAGDIIFEDTNLNDISYGNVHLLRRRIGVVFQDYRLLPELNVWENIALPLSISGQPLAEIEERVTDLLRLINLPQKAYLFPSQLSGGEAQRVSIARALAVGPSVIFADEPTGNLDQETSESIARLLKKINQLGTTVFFATHDISVLELFKKDRHLHLENGKLVHDTHATKSKPAKATKAKQAAPEASSEPDSMKEPDEKPEPEVDHESDEEQEPDKKRQPVTEPKPDSDGKDSDHEPTKKPGFFKRLFGRKHQQTSDSDSSPETAPTKKMKIKVESVD